MPNNKILKGLRPVQVKQYKQLKSILSKEIRTFTKYLIDASKGKLKQELELLAIEDANDLIKDYILILRDKVEPTYISTLFFDRDTVQRELINEKAYDLADKIADAYEEYRGT